MIGVAVHTTGVNIEGVLSVAVAVVILVTPLFAVGAWIARSWFQAGMSHSIGDALAPVLAKMDLIVTRMNEIDTRLAKLEGVSQERDRASRTAK